MISILNVRFTNSKDWPVFFGDGLFFKASSHPMSSSLNGASTLRCLRTWKGILDPREKGAASARSWGHGADSERNGVLSLCSSRFEIRKMKTNNDIYVYCIYIYIMIYIYIIIYMFKIINDDNDVYIYIIIYIRIYRLRKNVCVRSSIHLITIWIDVR
jgi:hypothetical protein